MSGELEILDQDIIACGKVIDKDTQHFIAISYAAFKSKSYAANQLQCRTKWGYTVCDLVVVSVIAAMRSKARLGKEEVGDE